jgi:hypothetical protein
VRTAWSRLNARFAGKRPDAFNGAPLYVVKMTDIATRLVATDMMLNSGRPEQAGRSLKEVRDDFHALRKSAGIEVLTDCVGEANAAMDALMVYNSRDLDWSKSPIRVVASKAAIYGYVLDRCDGMASAAVRQSPEFRRLVDGAKAGHALIPKAIATRDGDLLHRIPLRVRLWRDWRPSLHSTYSYLVIYSVSIQQCPSDLLQTAVSAAIRGEDRFWGLLGVLIERMNAAGGLVNARDRRKNRCARTLDRL